jgi:hypothetical protein
VRPEGLGKLIKIIHLIGSRTRDLPVCNTDMKSPLRIKYVQKYPDLFSSQFLSQEFNTHGFVANVQISVISVSQKTTKSDLLTGDVS